MIRSNLELYRNINYIIDILKKANKFKYAKKLEDVLNISTVTSEVLGETRIILKEIERSTFSKQLNIQEVIQLSLEYLDKIL